MWLRIPNVLHEHANLTETPWFQKIPDKFFNPFTDLAIAVSESTRQFCLEARKLSPKRVKVVYLGAPLEEFKPWSAEQEQEARRNLGLTAPGLRIVGTVTRLHESKGNRYFVDAAAILAKQRPELRFVLVGEGPLRPELEAQAARLGIEDRVVFAGFQKDVAAAYASLGRGGVSVALGRHAPHGVRGDGHGQAHCVHRCRWAARCVEKRRQLCRRAASRPAGFGGRDGEGSRRRIACFSFVPRRPGDFASIRHPGLRRQDVAPVRATRRALPCRLGASAVGLPARFQFS